MNILIVEDNTVTRESLGVLLEGRGCQLRYAGAVASAQAICSEFLPDRVYLDYMLPDGTGLDFLRWLRNRAAEIPVVLATAVGADEMITLDSAVAGLQPVVLLRKPIDPAHLVDLLL